MKLALLAGIGMLIAPPLVVASEGAESKHVITMQEYTLTFAEILSGARIIPLTKGQFTFVDAEDFEWISQWKWSYLNRGYAVRMSCGKMISMHGMIAGHRPDHRDHNKLNNRRHNLRPATVSQNNANRVKSKNNTSGFKGVSWNRDCRKWQAHIYIAGKSKYLGIFTEVESAHLAYVDAAKKEYGEFHCPG